MDNIDEEIKYELGSKFLEYNNISFILDIYDQKALNDERKYGMLRFDNRNHFDFLDNSNFLTIADSGLEIFKINNCLLLYEKFGIQKI